MKTILLWVMYVLFIPFINVAQEWNYSFKQAYLMETLSTLSVSTGNGDIKVLPRDEDSVHIYYSIEKNNKNVIMSEFELENEGIEIEVIHNNHGLEVNLKYPKRYSMLSFFHRISVNLEIYVPVETACCLRSCDGKIKLDGLMGDHYCRTNDGDIQISNIIGVVTAKTSDGKMNVTKCTGEISLTGSDSPISCSDIDGHVSIRSSDRGVSLSRINGSIYCKTSDGKILITDSHGDFTLKTSDGDVDFSNLVGSLVVKTSDGDVSGNINELRENLNIKTSDGKIDVLLPTSLGLDVNITGGSCIILKDDFLGDFGKNHMCGEVNGGGIPVSLVSHDGRIVLAYK